MDNVKGLMEKAIEQFENEQYELAVENFIKVYENDQNKEEILNILYSCFINPNENEFRANYGRVDKLYFPVNYDELSIDFIPVSNDIYYLYEKNEFRFLGKIDINQICKTTRLQDCKLYSLFISETWDIRELYNTLCSKKWNIVYILLDKNFKKFYSFFKLPYLVELLENVIIFRNEEIMNMYFNEYHNVYLPHKFIPSDKKYFKKYFNKLYKLKWENESYDRDSVLLTIGIPSFQRGKKAWECVNKLLNCPNNYKIQIVVSNNGSTNSQYYDKIKNINDSRITYFEFEENQGYASNVCKVLELSRGKFCILCSDEDELIIDNLPDLLKIIINYDIGFLRVSGIGDNMTHFEGTCYNKGLPSIIFGLGSNYITGCCINLEKMKKNGVMEFIREHRGNLFLEYYVHCVIAAYLGKYCNGVNCDIVLFKQGQDEDKNDERLLPYMTLDSRIEQEISCIELFSDLLEASERIKFIIQCCERTYYLIGVAYNVHDNQFVDGTTWRSLCKDILNRNINFFEQKYNGNELESLKLEINKLYSKMIVFTGIKENRLLKYRLSNGILEEVLKDKEYFTYDYVEIVDSHIQSILEELNVKESV